MLVRTWMSPDPVSVGATAPVSEARQLLHHYGFRHLPVVAHDRLLGVVSDRDVAACRHGHDTFDARPISTIMSSPPLQISVTDTVEAAARVMLSRQISSLPVVDESGALVGMITTTDCLLALLDESARVSLRATA